MTAEPSVRDRAAEFIAAHDPEDGHCEASCSCGVTIGEFAEGWSIHLANALAAAGLLAGEAPVTVTHGCVKRAPTDNVTVESIAADIKAGFIMDADPADECTDPTCRDRDHYVPR